MPMRGGEFRIFAHDLLGLYFLLLVSWKSLSPADYTDFRL